MWNTIKCLDDVKKDNRERFTLSHGSIHISNKLADVVESGELLAKAGLIGGEELVAIQVRDDRRRDVRTDA